MLNITHQPLKDFHRYYTVEANSIEEVISEMIPRIRKQSQEAYKNYLPDALNKKKEAIIDQHAGNGCFYSIKIIN